MLIRLKLSIFDQIRERLPVIGIHLFTHLSRSLRTLILLHCHIEVTDACIIIWISKFLIHGDSLIAYLDTLLELALLEEDVAFGNKIHITVWHNGESLIYYCHRRIQLIDIYIKLHESWEEIREGRHPFKSFLERCQIARCILLQIIGFGKILQHIVVMHGILQRYIRMMQRCLGILHLIAGIYGIIGSQRKMLILLAVIVRPEQRLVGTIYITVEELIGIGILLLTEEPQSTIKEIGADMRKIISMLLTEFDFHLSLFIRNHLYRIKLLRNLEELSGEIEELGSIILLLEIELFVTLLVLLTYGIEVEIPDFLVVLIGRISQKFLHACLRLRQVLARLHLILRQLYFLLLGKARRWHKKEHPQ